MHTRAVTFVFAFFRANDYFRDFWCRQPNPCSCQGTYRDFMFTDETHLRAAPRVSAAGPMLPQEYHNELVMRPLRCIIEMLFGRIVELWKFIENEEAQKILLCPVAKHWFNVIFITNC